MNRKSKWIEGYFVLLADCLGAVLSYFVALFLRYRSFVDTDHPQTYFQIILWILLFTILYDTTVGSGRNFLKRGYFIEGKSVWKYVFCQAIFMGFILFFLKEAEHFSRLVFGLFVIFESVLLLSCRSLLKYVLRSHFRTERVRTKVLLITEERSAVHMATVLKAGMDYDQQLTGVAIWSDTEISNPCQIEGIPILFGGSREKLIETIRTMAMDEVFIHLPGVNPKEIKSLIQDLEVMGLVCHFDLDITNLENRAMRVGDFAGFTVATYSIGMVEDRRSIVKRLIDIAGSLVGLLFTGILYPFVAIAIKLNSPGPVVFSQVRIGKNGRRFKIYKFRSMYIDAEERKKELLKQNEMQGLMFKMEDDPRITKVGKFIRKTSIDELPQFLNVLKGDMSLVGTRPPTEDEFEQYTPYYRRRLCMTPGLTGLWQVSGRSEVENFDDVVRLDLHYIDHWSLSLDIKILLQTVIVVLFGRGAK